jgi:mono/diheme cytochrome c family protein
MLLLPRLIVFSIASMLFLLWTVELSGQSPASDSSSSAGAKHGDQIFHQRCATCHNKQPGDTAPFGPPNLYDVFRSSSLSEKQAETIILQGKGAMPAFNGILSRSDIRSVISYLRKKPL